MRRLRVLLCLVLISSLVSCDSVESFIAGIVDGKAEEDTSSTEVSMVAQQLYDIVDSQRLILEDLKAASEVGDREGYMVKFKEFTQLEQLYQDTFQAKEGEIPHGEAMKIAEMHSSLVRSLPSLDGGGH